MAGLDFSAIRVPSSTSSGSIGSNILGGNGGSNAGPPSPISIGMNDDPAMVRDAFFKNPDQLALVSNSSYLTFETEEEKRFSRLQS